MKSKGSRTMGAIAPLEDASKGAKPHIHITLILLSSDFCDLSTTVLKTSDCDLSTTQNKSSTTELICCKHCYIRLWSHIGIDLRHGNRMMLFKSEPV